MNGVLDYQGNIISDTANQLVKSRQDAYKYYESIVRQMGKKGKLTSRQIGNVIDCLLSQEQYVECIGVTVFYLKRKRKQLEQQHK